MTAGGGQRLRDASPAAEPESQKSFEILEKIMKIWNFQNFKIAPQVHLVQPRNVYHLTNGPWRWFSHAINDNQDTEWVRIVSEQRHPLALPPGENMMNFWKFNENTQNCPKVLKLRFWSITFISKSASFAHSQRRKSASFASCITSRHKN